MRVHYLRQSIFFLLILTLSASGYANSCCNNIIEFDTSNYALPQPVLPKYLPEPQDRFCCIDYFSGVFFGLDWGYRWGPNELKVNAVSPTDLDDDRKVAITTNLNIGYGYTFCSFYLGGELAYLYRLRDKPSRYFFEPGSLFDVAEETVINFAQVPVYAEVQSQQGVSFDLLPGFLLAQKSLIFARFGIERDNYTWNRTFTIAQANANSVFFDSHDNRSETGYRIGVGFVQAITPHFDVGANFIYFFTSDIRFRPKEVEPLPISVDPIGFPSNVDAFFNSKNTIKPERFELTIGFRITL